MIEIAVLGDKDKAAWNGYVDRAPHSIAWQAYEWSDVIARHYEYKFFPLAALDRGKIGGILPLFLGSIGNGRGFISVPFAVAGGIVADDEAAQAALRDRAIQMSRDEGGIPIVLKQYKVRVPGNLKTDENYFNRELALHRDRGILRSRVDVENLAKAERARDLGLEVEYPAGDVRIFYDLLLRHHLAQGIPCVSEEWIKTLVDFKMYSFALARIKGRVIAATMIKKFKKTVSFPFSCVLPRSRESGLAAYGLYWDLICRFASEGFEIFHSGRIPRNLDAAGFRMGWGGAEYPYYYQYYPNTEGPTEFKMRRGLKRRLVSMAWKRLPKFLAKTLGPRFVRRFP